MQEKEIFEKEVLVIEKPKGLFDSGIPGFILDKVYMELSFYRKEDSLHISYGCEINPRIYRLTTFLDPLASGKTRLIWTGNYDNYSPYASKFAVTLNKFRNYLRFSNGDIIVDKDFRGLGLGSYIYGRLIELIKNDSYVKQVGEENISVSEPYLSPVDETPDNKDRRNCFYIKFGFQLEGERAFVKNLKYLTPCYNPNRFVVIKNKTLEEVVETEENFLKTLKEKLLKDSERNRGNIGQNYFSVAESCYFCFLGILVELSNLPFRIIEFLRRIFKV